MTYPTHHEVDSVEDAIALAETLRHAGEYDVFRGQTADWPMRTSYFRLDAEAQAAAQQRILEFAQFVHETPELAPMRGDRNALMAVAQHYGFPTDLLDFSTDPAVAGWFATHDRADDLDRPCIIYLAHTAFVEEQYRDRLPQLAFVRIEVANLWRLQAQSGLFLRLPFPDDPELDAWLAEAFGTIRFPYRGPMQGIPRAAIYPDRKSRLEVLFDGFLSEETQRRVASRIESLGLRRAVVPPSDRGEGPDDPSWQHADERWWRPPPETFRHQDRPPVLDLVVGDEGPDGVAHRIAHVLATHDDIRAGFVDVHLSRAGTDARLEDRPHPESRLRRTAGQDLVDCWDGMRRLPYPDDVLAHALGFLATAWALVHGDGRSIHDVTESLIEDSILVELGLARGGQHQMALAPAVNLADAFRDERRGEPPMRELHRTPDPRRAFAFNRLVSVFGRWLVPSQFLLRQRDVIFFSPARVERIGNR